MSRQDHEDDEDERIAALAKAAQSGAAAASSPEGIDDREALAALLTKHAGYVREMTLEWADAILAAGFKRQGEDERLWEAEKAEHVKTLRRAEAAEKERDTCRESMDYTRHRVLDALGMDHVHGWNHVPGAIGTIREKLAAAQAEAEYFRKALVHISTGSGVKHRDAQKIAHAALSSPGQSQGRGSETPVDRGGENA